MTQTENTEMDTVNSFPLISRLVAERSFTFHAWDDRYSLGVSVVLSNTHGGAQALNDYLECGDMDRDALLDFLWEAGWLPCLTGRSMMVAMQNLEERLASLPLSEESGNRAWADMVRDALDIVRISRIAHS
jgi:hypothetical protein